MKDFTLNMYQKYLEAIAAHYEHILRFDHFMAMEDKPGSFCLIRHDVDRKPLNALKMAELESKMNITSSYYFRTRSSVFKKDIIQKISALGHEIGYHYECLSDAKGEKAKALELFATSLNEMRKLVPVKTISMHGRPLSPFDNRDLWKTEDAKKTLLEKYELLGEIYLHIDYSNITYISDTGRNWHSSLHNKRDSVKSNVSMDFNSGIELLQTLKDKAPEKMVFQIHPERWTNQAIEFRIQQVKDLSANTLKRFL